MTTTQLGGSVIAHVWLTSSQASNKQQTTRRKTMQPRDNVKMIHGVRVERCNFIASYNSIGRGKLGRQAARQEAARLWRSLSKVVQ
jgi:hypothetical protein